MRSFTVLAVVSAFAGAVLATEDGTINVAMPAAPAPAPVDASADPSMVSVADLPYLQQYPYSWLQSGGYQQLQCGYGYYRNSGGYCQAESWVRRSPFLPPLH